MLTVFGALLPRSGVPVVTTRLALVTTAAHPGHGGSGADSVRRWFIVDRTVGYLALALLAGGCLFVAHVWTEGATVRRLQRLLAVAWALGFVASLGGLALQAATVHQGVDDVASTPVGRAWVARSLLYLLALPLLGALARDTRHAASATWWRCGAAAVGLGLLRTFGLVGHATEGDQAVVGAVANLVHVGAIAAWIGGLVVVSTVVLPRRRTEELTAVVPRFSALARLAVAAAIVAGAVLAWTVVGGFDPLLHTHYGRVLLLKLIVLGGALVAALASKRWTDRRLALAVALRADPVTVRPFVVSVATEVVLAVALLGIASVLVSTSPGT